MGLFKRKTPLQKLAEKHEKLLQQAFALSKTNRSESDKKYVEAKVIEDEISKLS